MTRLLFAVVVAAPLGCGKQSPGTGALANYLFVWAGPRDHESLGAGADHAANTDDFLAVVDADPASGTYGKVVASKDVGIPGEMAHHIELSLPEGHALFASDFMTGRVFLLDVSAVVGHYLVVPAATAHEVVSFDVIDPTHPAEVSSLPVDSTFYPHWIAVDAGSDRIVVNSSEQGEARVLLAHRDRRTGKLMVDTGFREAGSVKPGISFDHEQWRRAGAAPTAHAAVFGTTH